MKCPYCGNPDTRVIDSRPAEDNSSIRRRRSCDECGKRFTTYEKIETIPLIIIKKDNNREQYSRQKIENGIIRACYKRPVPTEKIQQAVNNIETKVFSLEEKEIPSSVVGELVMDELKDLAGSRLVSKLDEIIAQENINVVQLASMKLQSEYNGYITYVVPGLAKDLEKAGAKYVYHSVSREGDVIKILQSGGISSTMSRIKQGIQQPAGASMYSDMGTGGADNAFTRLVTGSAQKAKRKFSNASVAGDYQIKMSTAVLERTDYYSFGGDKFGKVADISKYGASPEQFVKNMENSFAGSNEIMFRNGIDSRYFTEIMCNSRYERQHLLSELRARGIMDINGIDIEKFITVGSEL